MAKKFKDLKEKKIKDSISSQQYNYITYVEDYIDSQIELHWEEGIIDIDYRITSFQIDPITLNPTGYDDELRGKMCDVLNLRFIDQDWKIITSVQQLPGLQAISVPHKEKIIPDTWSLIPKNK